MLDFEGAGCGRMKARAVRTLGRRSGVKRSKVRRGGAVLCGLLLAAAGGACRGKMEPVARVTVAPPTVTLAYPGLARLDTTWEATVPIDALGAPPVVFVHLLDAAGKPDRTFDHPFPEGWRTGAPMTDTIALWQSAMAPPLAPGRYPLSLGIWDPASGRRWPLAVDGAEVARDEYIVATVEVLPAPSSGAAVAFTAGWLPVEPTGDHQTFARRWLIEPGRLEFTGLGGPIAVGLRLASPAADGEDRRLVLDEGSTEAALVISSECAAAPLRFEPEGRSDLLLTLRPAAGATSCAVDLVPNFVFLDVDTFARRVVKLDLVTWNEVAE